MDAKPLRRKDAQERHTALCNQIKAEVKEDGQEFEGHVWAVLPMATWADLLGTSTKTVQRLIKIPPIQTTTTMVEGKRATLLRVGKKAELTHREMANLMAARFRSQTGTKKVDRRHWGMLYGLAKDLPAGYQVDIFKHVITPYGWASFMANVGIYIHFHQEVNGDKTLHKRHLKKPSISVLRRFPTVAADSYKTDMQPEKETEYDFFSKY
jgi:hypothetical protein